MASVSAPRGMVVTPHPLATRAGVDALRAGGTAVDAAVAANAVLAVVYCSSCGIGGDAFALVWHPGERRLHGFNGSGRSPAALTIDAVRERGHDSMPVRGPLTITVPGAVDAWAQLLARFGRRSFADALEPAARIADTGYRLTPIMASGIERSLETFDAAAWAVFAPRGTAPGPGEAFRQPLLATTLRQLAAGGPDAYYRGAIGSEIVTAVQAAGGVLSVDDLATHRGDWVEPISTEYRGVQVATTPPNSQGITALMALNVLSVLDGGAAWPSFGSLGRADGLNVDRLHAQIEALKVAWSERDRCVADPERHLAEPAALLSDDHARRLASRLSPDRAHRLDAANPGGGGTVFLCAADADGMMVSLIESNYRGFGCGLMGGSTGIMLHNRGAYFSLERGHPNALAPRSRTLHTLMPAMLLRNGLAEVAFGTMGGDGQAQTVVQLVNALVDDHLDPQAAVERPRFRIGSEPLYSALDPVYIERDGLDLRSAAQLRARGHEVTLVAPREELMGWAQIIRREADGTYSAGADPRADSLAAGL